MGLLLNMTLQHTSFLTLPGCGKWYTSFVSDIVLAAASFMNAWKIYCTYAVPPRPGTLVQFRTLVVVMTTTALEASWELLKLNK
jgi:hypothetical protein